MYKQFKVSVDGGEPLTLIEPDANTALQKVWVLMAQQGRELEDGSHTVTVDIASFPPPANG